MRLSLFSLPLAALSVFAGPELRAEFNPAYVSSDARWVAYVDLNAVRNNPLGKEAIAAIQKQGAEAVPLPGGTSMTLDVPKVLATIGSFTAYGANFEKSPDHVDGTLVVEGTPDLRKIIEAVLLELEGGDQPVVTDVKDLGYSAYLLTGKGQGHPVVIAFPPEGAVIVSQSADKVRRACDLLRGKGDSLAQAQGSSLAGMAGNAAQAMIFAASDIPPEMVAAAEKDHPGPHTRILQMTHSASLAVGETSGKTFIHAQLFASNDESADKLTKILEGMTAMLSLAQSNDQKMMDFINSARASRDGDKVSFQLAYDSTELAAMAKDMLNSKANHPHEGPRVASHGPNPQVEKILGQSVGEWTVAAPASTAPAADEPQWHDLPGVALKNGSQVTVEVSGDDEHAIAQFEAIQVKRDGDGVPLTFTRKTMTGVHHPLLAGVGHPGRLLHFDFPGEDGTYMVRVRFKLPAHGNLTFHVWVKNDSGSDNAPDSAPQT